MDASASEGGATRFGGGSRPELRERERDEERGRSFGGKIWQSVLRRFRTVRREKRGALV